MGWFPPTRHFHPSLVFAGKAWVYQNWALTGLKCLFPDLPPNVRLAWTWMTVANTLADYDTSKITSVKSFIVHNTGLNLAGTNAQQAYMPRASGVKKKCFIALTPRYRWRCRTCSLKTDRILSIREEASTSHEIMEQHTLKNVNDYSNTNIYSYLETSGGQSSNLYLNIVHFFNTSVN